MKKLNEAFARMCCKIGLHCCHPIDDSRKNSSGMPNRYKIEVCCHCHQKWEWVSCESHNGYVRSLKLRKFI